MITLYGLSFRNFPYVRKSIESLINNASEPFRFVVSDNPSDWPNSGTSQIRSFLSEMVNKGNLDKVLLFNNNNIGWSLVQAYKDFPPDDSESFFCMTDLDLAVDDGCDWIKEIRTAHDERGAVLTGCTLHMRNMVPPNWGYSGDSDGFGMWLMGINKSIFDKHHTSNINVIDSRMRVIFSDHGPVEKLLSIRLYHMAWDNHLYDLEYAKYKRELGSSWCSNPKGSDLSYELIQR